MNLKKLFLKYCKEQQYEVNQEQLDIINYLKIYYTENFKQNFLTKFFKKKNRNKIKPTGFIVGKNNIYLTTNHGRLLVMDIKTAKIISIIKIDANKISRPLTLNKKLFIIRDNSILKLN